MLRRTILSWSKSTMLVALLNSYHEQERFNNPQSIYATIDEDNPGPGSYDLGSFVSESLALRKQFINNKPSQTYSIVQQLVHKNRKRIRSILSDNLVNQPDNDYNGVPMKLQMIKRGIKVPLKTETGQTVHTSQQKSKGYQMLRQQQCKIDNIIDIRGGQHCDKGNQKEFERGQYLCFEPIVGKQQQKNKCIEKDKINKLRIIVGERNDHIKLRKFKKMGSSVSHSTNDQQTSPIKLSYSNPENPYYDSTVWCPLTSNPSRISSRLSQHSPTKDNYKPTPKPKSKQISWVSSSLQSQLRLHQYEQEILTMQKQKDRYNSSQIINHYNKNMLKMLFQRVNHKKKDNIETNSKQAVEKYIEQIIRQDTAEFHVDGHKQMMTQHKQDHYKLQQSDQSLQQQSDDSQPHK